MKVEEVKNEFRAVNGQFFPEQMSSRLFMSTKDIDNKYLVAFHERFHYLQYVFTPYGHLKWGANRSFTSEVIETWNNLTTILKKEKKIPIFEYMIDEDIASLKILSTVYFQDFLKRYSAITDGVTVSVDDLIFSTTDLENLVPKIIVNKKEYQLNGLDIIESFAKFEEALFGYLMENKDINEIINPDNLPPRYYIALYYFIDKVGMERLYEFPIACELSLAFSHLPRYNDEQSLYSCHPAWRFLKIIDYLKNNPELKPDVFSDDSFWRYTQSVLVGCEFEDWSELWKPAEEYAKQTDLTMAKEMLDAIKYKQKNPWCLSYPTVNLQFFLNADFERFHPLFIITDDRVFYNVENVSISELLFENEFQALALQICGHISPYNMFYDMLQCGDNYFGVKSCKHWLDGSCNGHLCKDTELPALELDENGNVINGCLMEIMLNMFGTSIKEITIGNMLHKYSLKEISEAVKLLEKVNK